MLEQVQTEKRDDLPSKILAMPNVDRYKMESIVWAAPMKLGEYAKLRGVPLPENEDPDANGFLVEQPGAPKNVDGFVGSIIWMVDAYFKDKFEVARVLKVTTHVERMFAELCEMTERIAKLEAFLKTEMHASLPRLEQQDQKDQLKAMQDYVCFLSRRVRRAGE